MKLCVKGRFCAQDLAGSANAAKGLSSKGWILNLNLQGLGFRV